MMNAKQLIAKRASMELSDGEIVNLGVGIPTLIPEYVPADTEIILHSENGILGMGPFPEKGKEDFDVINASCDPVTVLKGGVFMDSVMSFTIMRGGHLDATVLGAYEVDENGDLASWTIPGKKLNGMGGSMDLVVGAKRVIITMTHTSADGAPKLIKNCTLPLTGMGVVQRVITELCVLDYAKEERGYILRELAPGVSLDEVRAKTAAKLILPENIKVMPL